MAISGSCTISFRDFDLSDASGAMSDADLKTYCQSVLGDHLYHQIREVRLLSATGAPANRTMPSPDMESRGVSVGVSISF